MSGRVARSLMGAVAAVIVLAGCANTQAGTPASRTAAPAVSSPSPTPTPTSQAQRIPTTCDALMPSSLLAEIGAGLTPEDRHTEFATTWADERVGALSCRWSNGAEWPDSLLVQVSVGPEVTRTAFEGFLNGEQGGGTPAPAVASDAYTLAASGTPDGFLFLTPHYGVLAGLYPGSSVSLSSDAAMRALEHVHGVVAGLPAPGPLWVPTPNLRGATDCDSLATTAQLGEFGGLPAARTMKSDGGEYSTSLFDIDRQVGGYWCIWGADDATVSGTISVSVLPGGAEYAARARPAGSTDVAGIGEAAYVTPKGVLNVVASRGWLQVSGSDGRPSIEQAKALAKQVLVNVGYTG